MVLSLFSLKAVLSRRTKGGALSKIRLSASLGKSGTLGFRSLHILQAISYLRSGLLKIPLRPQTSVRTSLARSIHGLAVLRL